MNFFLPDWDKNWSLVPPNVHLFLKNGKISLKMKFFLPDGDKNWSLVPPNVHLFPKNGKISQKKKKFHLMGIKTGVWYPQMYICSLKMEKFN